MSPVVAEEMASGVFRHWSEHVSFVRETVG